MPDNKLLQPEMNDLLSEIEALSDEAVVLQKTVSKTRKNRSDLPLRFTVDENDHSLMANLTRYINSKNYVYQDLFDFCDTKASNEEEKVFWNRKAYNIIDSLKDQRSIRSDSIDIICEFLNVDIILEEKRF